METVYVVQEDRDFSGFRLMGVFSTYEAALSFTKTFSTSRLFRMEECVVDSQDGEEARFWIP